jgi:hypothetical protein
MGGTSDRAPFLFAGPWANNDKVDVTSCTIITLTAGEFGFQFHNRKLVILDTEIYGAWPTPETPGEHAKQPLHQILHGDRNPTASALGPRHPHRMRPERPCRDDLPDGGHWGDHSSGANRADKSGSPSEHSRPLRRNLSTWLGTRHQLNRRA